MTFADQKVVTKKPIALDKHSARAKSFVARADFSLRRTGVRLREKSLVAPRLCPDQNASRALFVVLLWLEKWRVLALRFCF